jgi:hypothetical protein
VDPYVAITLDKAEMLGVTQEVTAKHSYIIVKNTITSPIRVFLPFLHQ